MLSTLNKDNDLRSRLGKSRKGMPQFRDAIQVVVTNTNAAKPNPLKVNDSEVMLVVKTYSRNYN